MLLMLLVCERTPPRLLTRLCHANVWIQFLPSSSSMTMSVTTSRSQCQDLQSLLQTIQVTVPHHGIMKLFAQVRTKLKINFNQCFHFRIAPVVDRDDDVLDCFDFSVSVSTHFGSLLFLPSSTQITQRRSPVTHFFKSRNLLKINLFCWSCV
jgi:hypothetical protein